METPEIKIEFEKDNRLVKEKYGFLPKSVWNLTYSNKYRMLEIEDVGIKRSIAIGKKEYPHSRFNPTVAERVIKYWSNTGDLIIDPFMGYGMRGFVARNLGRRYVGYEISPKTFNQVKEKLNMPNLAENKNLMNIILGNGCYLEKTNDNSADMVFTCPPYWKVERYEKVQGQLSDCKSYNIFLEYIKICLNNCFRVLKQNKFMVWVVSDFRLDKQYYPLHLDLIKLASENRFKLHDIIINILHTPFLFAAPQQCDRMKITQKMHEYIIVFKKGKT